MAIEDEQKTEEEYSITIHGTWAALKRKSEWWRPRGRLFRYLQTNPPPIRLNRASVQSVRTCTPVGIASPGQAHLLVELDLPGPKTWRDGKKDMAAISTRSSLTATEGTLRSIQPRNLKQGSTF